VLALVAAYHQAAFGSPFRTAYGFPLSQVQVGFMHRGWLGYEMPTMSTVAMVGFGPEIGFFTHCPAAAIGVAGAVLSCRDPDRGVRACAAIAIGVVLLYWAMNAARVFDLVKPTGYTWGPRYLSPCVPFALLFAPRALARLPRAAAAASSALCVAIAWLGVQSDTLVMFERAPTLADRVAFAFRSGPRLGWIFVAAKSWSTPPLRLVPSVSALLLIAWGGGVAARWRTRDRALAALGAGVVATTLIQLWWCTAS
jgi:hypothetical protein